MDWPNARMPAPPLLTPWHIDAVGWAFGASIASTNLALGSGGSVSWEQANKGFFYPFRMRTTELAQALFVMPGTTPSGNIDIAIYRAWDKKKIVGSGSTAIGTADTVQVFDIADTELPPGEYLLGIAASATTVTVHQALIGTDEDALSNLPIYEQASTFPLADPCVPVVTTAGQPRMIVFGIAFVPVF